MFVYRSRGANPDLRKTERIKDAMTTETFRNLTGCAGQIEEVRKSCEDRVREAGRGHAVSATGADCASDPTPVTLRRQKQADFALAQALADALLLYFNVSTYEYFVVTPGISEFTTLLVKLDAMATVEFPGAPLTSKSRRDRGCPGRRVKQRFSGPLVKSI